MFPSYCTVHETICELKELSHVMDLAFDDMYG
jgi:hypothetical protein